MKPAIEKLLRGMALVGDAMPSYQLEEMATAEPATTPLRLHATRMRLRYPKTARTASTEAANPARSARSAAGSAWR